MVKGRGARRPDREEIPIIDLGMLDSGDVGALNRVALAAGRACEQVGFFFVRNHGVPQNLIDDVFRASARFFALPLESKKRLAINAFHRGYIGLESYALDETLSPNLSESFVIMHEVKGDDPRFGQPLQGPNQWPDELPGWRELFLRYDEALNALGQKLLSVFAVALSLPPDFFRDMFRRPTTFLRLLRYPPQRADSKANQFGSAPHSDYGAITVLAQDETGGLHVEPRAGGWLEASPLPGTFVVNIGDVMARWTNDRFVSTPHRVLNLSGRERYSIPFFFDPDMRCTIDCLETCRNRSRPPRHEPIRYGDYLLSRLDAHYAYRKEGRADLDRATAPYDEKSSDLG